MIDGDLQTARVHFFKALGDSTRLRILWMLSDPESASGGLTVTEIYQRLKREQNLISHHLACLKNCGLVTTAREGKNIRYRIRSRKVFRLLSMADAHIRELLEGILACEVVMDKKTRSRRNARILEAG